MLLYPGGGNSGMERETHIKICVLLQRSQPLVFGEALGDDALLDAAQVELDAELVVFFGVGGAAGALVGLGLAEGAVAAAGVLALAAGAGVGVLALLAGLDEA